MPKKGRGRRRPLVTIPDAVNLSLGTLANDGCVKSTAVVPTDDFFCYSVDLTAALRDLSQGEGPIKIGWTNADLTTAEILEAVDAVPLGASDIIERERAKRPCRFFGVFSGTSAAQTPNSAEVLNDGKTLRIKILRKFSKGVGFQFFAVNRSGGALTTGGIISLDARWYGRWL